MDASAGAAHHGVARQLRQEVTELGAGSQVLPFERVEELCDEMGFSGLKDRPHRWAD